MKCIIYGLGSGRLRVEQYLKGKHEIVGYSDSFYDEDEFNYKEFYKPEDLHNKNFDVVIIAVGDKAISEKIYSNLINYNVNEKKILNFYQIYLCKYRRYLNIPLKKVDRVVKQNYNGIILGISHAVSGINPAILKGKFCNLAMGSQDLFYNLRTLQILVEKYSDNIKGLEYAIIDMHKYTYFNYDVSLSKRAVQYYKESGFRSDDCHNFNRNKNFNKSIEEELIKAEADDEKMNLFNELFETNNIDINRDYKETGAIDNYFKDYPIVSERNSCITLKDLESYKMNCKPSSIQRKRFKNTIRENVEIFDKLMKTLKCINPEMKIYIVLIPQHKIVEDFEKNIEKDLKKEFYDILNTSKKKYNFKIFDFKNYEEISSHNDYYYDIRHLNNMGARVFTNLLNSYIERG